MTNTPTIMIMKDGKTIGSTDIRDYKFHSGHTMYKIHDIKTGTINLYTGDQTGYVDITHGLDYVPKFLVYVNGQLFPTTCRSYATNSIIRVKIDLGSPYNRETFIYNPNQIIINQYGSFPTIDVITGELLDSGNNSALWFNSIGIEQGKTITSANFEWKNVKTTNTNDIKFRCYGIDEDNTADLGGGYPWSRPRTTAYTDKTQSANTNYFNFGDNWTSILQEIVNRSGWSNGNHMAFTLENNGTTEDKIMYQDRNASLNNINLTIVLDGTATSPFVNDVRVVVFKDKITD